MAAPWPMPPETHFGCENASVHIKGLGDSGHICHSCKHIILEHLNVELVEVLPVVMIIQEQPATNGPCQAVLSGRTPPRSGLLRSASTALYLELIRFAASATHVHKPAGQLRDPRRGWPNRYADQGRRLRPRRGRHTQYPGATRRPLAGCFRLRCASWSSQGRAPCICNFTALLARKAHDVATHGAQEVALQCCGLKRRPSASVSGSRA